MSYQLGIDLGTTYTAAAVSRATERQHADPEMVSLGDRAVQVPSVLYLAPDGSVLVGEAAERRSSIDPDRVVREFKRQVGDEVPLVVGGSAYPAHELAAFVTVRAAETVHFTVLAAAERVVADDVEVLVLGELTQVPLRVLLGGLAGLRCGWHEFGGGPVRPGEVGAEVVEEDRKQLGDLDGAEPVRMRDRGGAGPGAVQDQPGDLPDGGARFG